MKIKKILIISTSDSGGAGNAAYRTHLNLLGAGYDSKMLVFKKSKKDNTIIEFNFPIIGLLQKGYRKIKYIYREKFDKNIQKKYSFFNYSEISNYIPTWLLIKFFPFHPDIIIYHSITHFINARNIYEIWSKFNSKTFWYLMDMAPLTGGCHFAWDCLKYQSNCGKCPALSSTNEQSIASNNFTYKSKYLSKLPIIMVASTEQILIQLKGSGMFVEKIKKKIMIGLDPNVFKIRNKLEARSIFNIPSNSKVIFAGSQYPLVERKGFKYFIESLEILYKKLNFKTNNVIVLLAGNVSIPFVLPFELKFVGHLNESQLIKAYQSADVFLCSSIEDTGPLMINESILSGTPVVSFNIGGAIDLIENGETGYKVTNCSAEDLAEGLYNILITDDKDQINFTQRCREKGLTTCSSYVQVEQFKELFNN